MPGRGLSGLANVGNTCYLNSCLQALSHTPELKRLVTQNRRVPHGLRRCVESLALVEWRKLQDMMWDADCTIAPHGFVAGLRRVCEEKGVDLDIGTEQNDAQEFLQFLIECMHVALGRSVDMTVSGEPQTDQDLLARDCYASVRGMFENEYSEVLPVFYGVHVSMVSGRDDSILSTRPEPFSVLSLPIPSGPTTSTLDQCFDAYCAPCELTGENQYETDAGDKVDATRSLFFWNLPQIMVVLLKRWVYGSRKDQRLVDAPIDLDLSRHVRGYNPQSFVYSLYAVCNHMGGVGGGHYTAYVRPDGMDAWYEFNDTLVRRMDPRRVVTPYAYCLFYRKK